MIFYDISQLLQPISWMPLANPNAHHAMQNKKNALQKWGNPQGNLAISASKTQKAQKANTLSFFEAKEKSRQEQKRKTTTQQKSKTRDSHHL
ncbi:MAG: hypothetical protein K6F46_02000 [Desulfovibrio sp.]|nr:hypothetical protein [Desulfovibrio sp.]